LSGNKVRLFWEGRQDTPSGIAHSVEPAVISRIYPHPVKPENSLWPEEIRRPDATPENRMCFGDNSDVMQYLLRNGYENRFNLIYIDPPYLSNQKYLSRIEIGDKTSPQPVERQVFRDNGPGGLDAFLEQMFLRLQLMKDLLNENGSLFVHLDWHVSHYAKVLLDEIFGSQTMINEIVWCYGGGTGTRRHFHRKHDLILWYAKGPDYTFNPQYRSYSPGTVQRGLTRVKGDRYKLHSKGALMQDWWSDINKILSPTAHENLKFPTQKPLALLERIIAAASNPGDLVGDFYAGSATAAQACEASGRFWVTCDNSPIAIDTAMKRLIRMPARPFTVESMEASSHETGKLVLKPLLVNDFSSEDILLQVGIQSYRPGQEIKPAPAFSYIDFWEIDLNYDGKVFNSDLQVVRASQRMDSDLPLQITARLKKPSTPIEIAIRVHDVFGDTVVAIARLNS
jgi:site-specific DNA-methyltransferase (adenine-specific)